MPYVIRGSKYIKFYRTVVKNLYICPTDLTYFALGRVFSPNATRICINENNEAIGWYDSNGQYWPLEITKELNSRELSIKFNPETRYNLVIRDVAAIGFIGDGLFTPVTVIDAEISKKYGCYVMPHKFQAPTKQVFVEVYIKEFRENRYPGLAITDDIYIEELGEKIVQHYKLPEISIESIDYYNGHNMKQKVIFYPELFITNKMNITTRITAKRLEGRFDNNTYKYPDNGETITTRWPVSFLKEPIRQNIELGNYRLIGCQGNNYEFQESLYKFKHNIRDTFDKLVSESKNAYFNIPIHEYHPDIYSIVLYMMEIGVPMPDIRKYLLNIIGAIEEPGAAVQDKAILASSPSLQSPNSAKKNVQPEDTLKVAIWTSRIGIRTGDSVCSCCRKIPIQQLNFDLAMLISPLYGGKFEADNLRPVCRYCKLRIGELGINIYKNPKAYPGSVGQDQLAAATSAVISAPASASVCAAASASLEPLQPKSQIIEESQDDIASYELSLLSILIQNGYQLSGKGFVNPRNQEEFEISMVAPIVVITGKKEYKFNNLLDAAENITEDSFT